MNILLKFGAICAFAALAVPASAQTSDNECEDPAPADISAAQAKDDPCAVSPATNQAEATNAAPLIGGLAPLLGGAAAVTGLAVAAAGNGSDGTSGTSSTSSTSGTGTN